MVGDHDKEIRQEALTSERHGCKPGRGAEV